MSINSISFGQSTTQNIPAQKTAEISTTQVTPKTQTGNPTNVEDKVKVSKVKKQKAKKAGLSAKEEFGAFFSRMPDEKMKKANQEGKLPDGYKIVQGLDAGSYRIAPDFVGKLIGGTSKIPLGFELKKGILGFVKVLPQGSEGLFLRKDK